MDIQGKAIQIKKEFEDLAQLLWDKGYDGNFKVWLSMERTGVDHWPEGFASSALEKAADLTIASNKLALLFPFGLVTYWNNGNGETICASFKIDLDTSGSLQLVHLTAERIRDKGWKEIATQTLHPESFAHIPVKTELAAVLMNMGKSRKKQFKPRP